MEFLRHIVLLLIIFIVPDIIGLLGKEYVIHFVLIIVIDGTLVVIREL